MKDADGRRTRTLSGGFWIVALALLVRAVYVVFGVARRGGVAQVSDFLYTHQLADSLAHGRGFTIEGVPIFNQSVGYPAFLAPFYAVLGAHVAVALALNVLLGAAGAWLVYRLTDVLLAGPGGTGAERPAAGPAARVAGVLAAVYPDSLLYAGLVSAENLLIPILLLLALAVVTRFRHPWAQGVVVGLLAAAGASVKAYVLIWVVGIPFLWLVKDRRFVARTAWAAIAGLIALLPWTIRNYAASDGHLIPFAAVAGEVFLDGNNPLAAGTPSNHYRLSPEEEAGRSAIDIDRLRMRQGLRYIRQDPAWFARLCVKKMIHAVSPVRDYMFEFQGSPRLFTPAISRWAPTAFNALLMVLCLCGLVAVRRQPLALTYGLSMGFAAVLLQLIFCAYSRYRFPFLFGLLPLCGAGVSRWRCRVRDRTSAEDA